MTTTLSFSKLMAVKSSACLLPTAAVLFASASAMAAAPDVIVTPPASGSTTVVEQYTDGNVTTITATPNGIEMRNGSPYAVTQVSNVPRYVVNQGNVVNTTTVIPVSSQATQVAITPTSVVTNTSANPVTVTTVQPIQTVQTVQTTPTVQPVQIISGTPPALTNQLTSTLTLDALQLNPTFSTPGVVKAQTKIMKVLKDASGQEFAVPANHIAPGDVIEYHTTYLNASAQPVSNVNATVTLPNGVKLVSLNSPLPTQGLVNNGIYQPIGQVGNTTVIQDNYSGLQWNLVNLAPNASETVIMRATVQ